jgi:hypothetical protein
MTDFVLAIAAAVGLDAIVVWSAAARAGCRRSWRRRRCGDRGPRARLGRTRDGTRNRRRVRAGGGLVAGRDDSRERACRASSAPRWSSSPRWRRCSRRGGSSSRTRHARSSAWDARERVWRPRGTRGRGSGLVRERHREPPARARAQARDPLRRPHDRRLRAARAAPAGRIFHVLRRGHYRLPSPAVALRGRRPNARAAAGRRTARDPAPASRSRRGALHRRADSWARHTRRPRHLRPRRRPRAAPVRLDGADAAREPARTACAFVVYRTRPAPEPAALLAAIARPTSIRWP